jgi:cytochrome c oxidase assembly protein subunit 15
MSKPNVLLFRIALLTALLAYAVVLLGAYTRLSDAGLGCPDWPGCYGRLIAPSAAADVEDAAQAYPSIRVEPAKAWTEMVHRYVAGALGILIVVLALIGFRDKRKPKRRWLAAFLVVLVVFQAVLGMWTVTLQLKPLVVMGHLLGGLAIMALLWWLVLREQNYWKPVSGPATLLRRLRPRAWIALTLVVVQIALGGWTSANYVALVCPDFPTCQGQWWPNVDFADGFVLWRGLGVNYEGGVLSLAAATAVHMGHRLGALITFLYVGWLALHVIRVGGKKHLIRQDERAQRAGLHLIRQDERAQRAGLHLCRYGLAMLIALLTQIVLGVVTVLTHLPLPVAVAHNGVAVLLLLSVVTFIHALHPPRA